MILMKFRGYGVVLREGVAEAAAEERPRAHPLLLHEEVALRQLGVRRLLPTFWDVLQGFRVEELFRL